MERNDTWLHNSTVLGARREKEKLFGNHYCALSFQHLWKGVVTDFAGFTHTQSSWTELGRRAHKWMSGAGGIDGCSMV
jgi:hypothetical protein